MRSGPQSDRWRFNQRVVANRRKPLRNEPSRVGLTAIHGRARRDEQVHGRRGRHSRVSPEGQQARRGDLGWLGTGKGPDAGQGHPSAGRSAWSPRRARLSSLFFSFFLSVFKDPLLVVWTSKARNPTPPDSGSVLTGRLTTLGGRPADGWALGCFPCSARP